ncbi:ATP-binding cassette domain-containing protein, partial [Thermodesulfovibrio yellowstonii]|uniref:ATP-binding cassette domain-containing protein n=1 Tax=Thermodesulfovibrio yellowstonii TaxID=28262 RepID=UPI003C79A4D5
MRLTVSNIYKYYNGIPLFENCSYTFDRSGVYVLMGPNGSGKSTFLRMCALLESPDRGKINYFENKRALPKDINLMRRITLLLPEVGVFNTTVFKNVAYGLKI